MAAIVLRKTNKYQLFTIQSSNLNINVNTYIHESIYTSSADVATASVSFPVLNHIFELLCISSGFYCVRQRVPQNASSVQFSSVQFSSVQFSSVQFSSVQFSSVQFI